MGIIIDGKALSTKIKQQLKLEVELLKKQTKKNPKLAVILVGNDPASKIYVKNKSKACNEVGISFEEFNLSEEISMQELINLIEQLNSREDINGILLQAPLPKQLNQNIAFAEISPDKDVDGFNPINIGKLFLNEATFIPCTPYGVIRMFQEYNIDLEGKNIVVIGRSNIVGKPMAQLLINQNATVTICHSKTNDLSKFTKVADIIISAVGHLNILTSDMVKENAVVIDVGINRREDGTLAGDVDFEELSKKASFITPVPGGVGPMTIAMLMENTIKAWKLQNNLF